MNDIVFINSVRLEKSRDAHGTTVIYHNDRAFRVSSLCGTILEALKENNGDINNTLDSLRNGGVEIEEEKIHLFLVELFNRLKEKKDKEIDVIWSFKTKVNSSFYEGLLHCLFPKSNNRILFLIILLGILQMTVVAFQKNIPIELVRNSNLFLSNMLIICLFILTLVWHEIGHMVAAKKYGIEVGNVGVGVYTFFPVLYVDLNRIWHLSRKERIIVNLGGVYFQLLLNMIFILAVVLFNSYEFFELFKMNSFVLLVNMVPFLKFDGYWILSDFLKREFTNEKVKLYL